MRKISLFIILLTGLSAPMLSMAQRHHPGDTIFGRSPYYHYDWWSEDWLSDTTHKLNLLKVIKDTMYNASSAEGISHSHYGPWWNNFNGTILRRCNTGGNKPLTIYGIAGAWTVEPYYIFDGYHSINLSTPFNEPYTQDSLFLYEYINDTFQLLKAVQWHYDDPNLFMKLDVRDLDFSTPLTPNSLAKPADTCCRNEDDYTVMSHTIPIWEYYFDTPVVVVDSFYVGYSTSWSKFDNPPNIMDSVSNALFLGYFPFPGRGDECRKCPGLTPHFLYKYRGIQGHSITGTYLVDGNWHWTEFPEFLLVFPIIGIDSTEPIVPPAPVCPPVENFRLASRDKTSATLLWDTHVSHQSWQVSYGPQGTPPDSGTLLNCSLQVGQPSGLDSATHYTAYIRAVCNFDSLCYSQWSDPIDIPPYGEPWNESIETTLEHYTYLIPNPATTQVKVFSSFSLTRVEAFDLGGRQLLDMQASGLSASFSVEGWNAGTYIVIIHTPQGRTAKKLVVK